ncbi:hypothetical protein [Mucilaginibacter sp. UYCu711]|uniref:hypothetical protein n=1 Tax=Mucilaginibacter sp. UYCu711 TaxID=3156339 RepID=UPI003D220C6E
MRSTFKFTLAALAAVLIYSSCSKSVTEPAPSANKNSAQTLAISKQIATNLYRSLTGGYGGANIGSGIKAPSAITAAPKGGRRVNAVTPYCGMTIDTTLYFDFMQHDTTTTVDSKYKFTYTCSTNSLDGYILSDSITYTDKTSTVFNRYITGQNYTVQNASADFSVVAMYGTIGTSFRTSNVNPSSHATTNYNYNDTKYSLNNLLVNVRGASPDITGGSVNFVSNITYLEVGGSPVTGGFSGTITFLGNHMAKMSVTYNGVTTLYSYNLVTNDVDPI